MSAGLPTPAPAAAWQPMLRARPLRNEAARVEPLARGLALYVPRRRPRWLVPPLSWILAIRKTARVALDPLGAQVWNLCDGERTVEAIVDTFARQHALSFHESRVAVTQYVKMLIQHGILAVNLPADARKEAP